MKLKQEVSEQISPEWVRISAAAAIELGLARGRIARCSCDCINLLQNYPEGCYANCSYCGLARERPGLAADNSFIRVAWPLFPTAEVAERIADLEARNGVGRVCISQVQDHRAREDLLRMTETVHRAAPEVPISALVSATLLKQPDLIAIREAGADIIGIGLDAASEELFYRTRGRGAKGPHDWGHHWKVARAARALFGPWRVNLHVIVGLGETDRELVELFCALREEQICAYLFSFNPEPGTFMADAPRAPIVRLRRVQLVKHLIEKEGLDRGALSFDDFGELVEIDAPQGLIDAAIDNGTPFMTEGCPDRAGEVACNRPYGSYRPGESYRDYPFQPDPTDLRQIRSELGR